MSDCSQLQEVSHKNRKLKKNGFGDRDNDSLIQVRNKKKRNLKLSIILCNSYFILSTDCSACLMLMVLPDMLISLMSINPDVEFNSNIFSVFSLHFCFQSSDGE